MRIVPVEIAREETDRSAYQQVIQCRQSNAVVIVQKRIDEREDSEDGDDPIRHDDVFTGV